MAGRDMFIRYEQVHRQSFRNNTIIGQSVRIQEMKWINTSFEQSGVFKNIPNFMTELWLRTVKITPPIAYAIADMFTINTGMVVTVVKEAPRYASGNRHVCLDDY